MAMEMRQQLRLSQQLVMTPQLQQAIKLLQMTRVELQDVVRQELEENPLLEEHDEYADDLDVESRFDEHEALPQDEPSSERFDEVVANGEVLRDWDEFRDGYSYSVGEHGYDGEERPSPETYLTKSANLRDHLINQLQVSALSDQDRLLALFLIGCLEDDGYLRTPLTQLAEQVETTPEHLEEVLVQIQGFDPPGVAARSLQECLLIQAHEQGMADGIVGQILQHHIQELEQRALRQIARSLRVEPEDVLAAIARIATLDPAPGRRFSSETPQYISPDIFVTKVADDYVVTLNEEGLPSLRLSPYYTGMRKGDGLDSKADEYISERTRAAQWLIKSIQQRQRTIYRVAKSIVKFQRDFLERGVLGLKPLVLRDVAEDIGMHESTISRVTTNKYMQTPQGLFELKYFFSSGLSTSDGDSVSSESVKDRIKTIIEAENQAKPLSDQKIAEMLSDATVNIARRTVTKYRELMRIGSSSERRRSF